MAHRRSGKHHRFPFEGFPHVCLFGLGRSGVDAEFRAGLNAFRGTVHKWLIHDIGRSLEGLPSVLAGEIDCDVLVGSVQATEWSIRLQELDRPVLDLRGEFASDAWRTWRPDWEEAGRQGARHFAASGYRHFCFYSAHFGVREDLCWRGFHAEASAYADSLHWLIRYENRIVSGAPGASSRELRSTTDWFATMPRPTAMLTFDDFAAETVAELAFLAHVAIPEELCLCGLGNNSTVCEAATPPLSSIDLTAREWGRRVGAHIEQVLSGNHSATCELISPARIVSRASTAATAIKDPLVAKALHRLRDNATQGLSIGALFDDLPISRRTLGIRFKQALGRTPKEELLRIRLSLAREQLRLTTHTVSHVADDCGFLDAETMARCFREHLGMTPSQFRRKVAAGPSGTSSSLSSLPGEGS